MLSFNIQRFAVSMQLRDGSIKGIVTTDDIDTLNYGGGVVFGYRIKKNESDPYVRVEYTDACQGYDPLYMDFETNQVHWGSWENSFVVNAFRPVALKYDGTVDYELDHDDQTKKIDGTASDISDVNYGGNFMVGVKKLYFWCYEDFDYHYCKISSVPYNEHFKCYAHIDNDGKEKPEIYLPMFKGHKDSSNRLRSIAGVTPVYSSTGANEIIWAKNNGAGWYTDDFINTKMIENIMILLTKSCDFQSTLGRGFCDGTWSNKWEGVNNGQLVSQGPFWGSSASGTSVKTLWLENYYGDRWDRIAGCINNKGIYYIKPTRPYNDNGGTTGYINTGLHVPSVSGTYQSSHVMTSVGLLPIACNGSDSTYIPDGFWSNNSQVDYALRGGYWNGGSLVGFSYLVVDSLFSGVNASLGASPCYK